MEVVEVVKVKVGIEGMERDPIECPIVITGPLRRFSPPSSSRVRDCANNTMRLTRRQREGDGVEEATTQ